MKSINKIIKKSIDKTKMRVIFLDLIEKSNNEIYLEKRYNNELIINRSIVSSKIKF